MERTAALYDSFERLLRCYILADTTLLDATNFDAPRLGLHAAARALASPIQLPYNDIVKGVHQPLHRSAVRTDEPAYSACRNTTSR